MKTGNRYNAYLSNHYEGMDPKRLILMLYDGALKYLNIAREGVLANSPKIRGEGLSKVIGIVTELQSSVSSTMQDELTQFLRGLYASMLIELVKVSVDNDIKPIDLSISYISKLREIWIKNVMKAKTVQPAEPVKRQQSVADNPVSYGKNSTYGNNATYGNNSTYPRPKAKSFAKVLGSVVAT